MSTSSSEERSSQYRAWIDDYVEKHGGHVRGLCQGAASAMAKEFPELKVVRGYVGFSAHWWCTAPDGSIVDPTASQFGKPEPEAYRPFDEELAHTLPNGKCMNCGEYLYYGASACSLHCVKAILQDIDGLAGEELETAAKNFKVNPPEDDPNYPRHWETAW